MRFYVNRYKQRIERAYSMEVVTPLFLGGANPEQPELRAASVKGLLRYWWRARNGSNDIAEMKRIEDEIFGSTEKKGRFSLTPVDGELKINRKPTNRGQQFIIKTKGEEKKQYIFDYLLFGVHKRAHIIPGSKFALVFHYEDREVERIIEQAFSDLITFGGLGAKSRNGMGGLFSKDITSDHNSITAGNLKPYTAFSSESRLFEFDTHETWHEALSEIGMAYREARLSVEPPHNFEKRLLIAKPLIQARIPDRRPDSRHAKPYFLKVNKTLNNSFQGQILFLTYAYHDRGRRKDYEETCNIVNNHLRSKCRREHEFSNT